MIAALLIWGCAGGSPTPEVDGPAPLHVVVLGSSTAAGVGPVDARNAWVERYRAHLSHRNPRSRVTNLARPGYTTFHVRPTWADGATERPAVDPDRNVTAALTLDPDALLVNLPSNDAAAGFPLDEQLRNLAQVVDAADAVPVWISTTQPRNLDQPGRGLLVAMRDATGQVAPGRTMDFWTELATPDGRIAPRWDAGDGVHLNDEAHALLLRRVLEAGVPPR